MNGAAEDRSIGQSVGRPAGPSMCFRSLLVCPLAGHGWTVGGLDTFMIYAFYAQDIADTIPPRRGILGAVLGGLSTHKKKKNFWGGGGGGGGGIIWRKSLLSELILYDMHGNKFR